MPADKETRTEARAIYRILTKTYPEIRCELDFKNPLELIVAVVLSAQCTDKRVNQLTPALFRKYKKAMDYAKAPLPEIEEFIFSAGFHHTKARHLKGLGTKLVEEFNGDVPATLEELITLPGVGRKTANVVLGHEKEWTNLSQRMIWHGRRICHSRKPACGACPVAKLCPSVGIGEMDPAKAALLVKTDKDFR